MLGKDEVSKMDKRDGVHQLPEHLGDSAILEDVTDVKNEDFVYVYWLLKRFFGGMDFGNLVMERVLAFHVVLALRQFEKDFNATNNDIFYYLRFFSMW